jgi:hypothetical protein
MTTLMITSRLPAVTVIIQISHTPTTNRLDYGKPNLTFQAALSQARASTNSVQHISFKDSLREKSDVPAKLI